MPGGLRTTYGEDAERVAGIVQRFGYRSSAPVLKTGIEDQYLPTQGGGAEYRLRDTWGLQATRVRSACASIWTSFTKA